MRIVKLKIDDKATEFKLPTSWDEVSVAQYSKLMLAIEKEGTTEIELMIKSLEALVGIDGGILTKVPIKMLREAYKQLGELTSSMPSNELSRVVEIDGIEYGIIPDFNELTLGEFVDLDNYLQDNYNNLNKIFAVLYRPVIERDGNSYNIEPYSLKNISDRRELFNNRLSIDTVYGALVFFCSIGSKHIESTLYSLEEEKMSQSIIKSSQIKEIV
tara:strand:- start:781 stop:1425 length:645 start_codon:yes stop_codon:yes gene_type:complete